MPVLPLFRAPMKPMITQLRTNPVNLPGECVKTQVRVRRCLRQHTERRRCVIWSVPQGLCVMTRRWSARLRGLLLVAVFGRLQCSRLSSSRHHSQALFVTSVGVSPKMMKPYLVWVRLASGLAEWKLEINLLASKARISHLPPVLLASPLYTFTPFTCPTSFSYGSGLLGEPPHLVIRDW